MLPKKRFFRSLFKIILLAAIIVFSNDCGKGIAPLPEQEAGFSGTINFIGTWPDSVQRTHLVIFKDPLNSITDFNILNLRYVSLEIPNNTSEYQINSLDSAFVPQSGHLGVGEYSYVCVAQSKTPSLSFDRKDWYVVGVYYANGDTTKPGKLDIPNNTLVKNINITCDFNHPPPQPPGGN